MRIHGFTRYDFTADLWTWTEVFGPGSDVRLDYAFSKVIPLYFASDPNSIRQTIYIKEPIKIRDHLLNIKNKNGFRIMGDAQYEIKLVEPVINVFHEFEGWRCSATLVNVPSFDPPIFTAPTIEMG